MSFFGSIGLLSFAAANSLKILSSVLCDLWSLGATVRGQAWIPECGGPESRTLNHQRTLDPVEPLAKALPKTSNSALRPSTTKRPVSASARHPIPILQQNRATTLHISRLADKVIPNPQTAQNMLLNLALTFGKTGFTSIHQNTGTSSPNQENFMNTSSISPTGRRLQIKSNDDLPTCRKETSNTVN